uniref:CMP-N-acetylneuraminate-beta-galactosamide-alpha-2,3-sialyltransferase 2 n=1 Tax=Hucho hucho TaxID=62062 RepID=A0A4W5QAP3_9TELE
MFLNNIVRTFFELMTTMLSPSAKKHMVLRTLWELGCLCCVSTSSVSARSRVVEDTAKGLTVSLSLQRLQGEKDPANFSEVVEKMFHVIPDDDDLYMDAGPERCRTCAVVGNSGNLKGSRYGPLIDSSDVIIRMNMAPTSGFEEDVGSRTTHHVMYPESAKDLDNTTTSLLLIPFKTLDLQWITSALTTGSIKQTYIPVRSRIKANKNRVLIYSPTFFKYVYDTWLESHGRYPSTGFLSIMFAVHICDKVSVYGFGRDQYGNWHHYWEDDNHGGAFRKTGVHDADQEHNLYKMLHLYLFATMSDL